MSANGKADLGNQSGYFDFVPKHTMFTALDSSWRVLLEISVDIIVNEGLLDGISQLVI